MLQILEATNQIYVTFAKILESKDIYLKLTKTYGPTAAFKSYINLKSFSAVQTKQLREYLKPVFFLNSHKFY